MRRGSCYASLSPLVAVLLGGCTTPPPVVQTRGHESIVSADHLDVRDCKQLSEGMIQSLLASDVLDRVSNPPAIIAFSRIENRTSRFIDLDLLLGEIRRALILSGKAVFMKNSGISTTGELHLENPASKAIEVSANSYVEGKAVRPPDYVLCGKIMEQRAQTDNLRQVTFTFQLSLSKADKVVWEDRKELTKQCKVSGRP